MGQTNATRASDTFYPPVLSGSTGVSGSPAAYDTVHQLSTGAAAARAALGLGSEGKFYVTVQAGTQDHYIAFKLGTAAASVTTTTGLKLLAGASVSFWITSTLLNDIEAISPGGNSTLKWYRSSPIYDNNVI